MEFSTIIVQAGGKGTRMEHLTCNKPKALISINNLPMIFHLFNLFPQKRFIIIGDYKADVLEKYLKTFATVTYSFVICSGKSGTCAGIRESLALVPDNEPFMLTWCDLILPQDYCIPEKEQNYIGISKDFRCRWSYDKNVFKEEPSETHGVAGHFLFINRKEIEDVPEEGEFVRWLQQKRLCFEELPLYKTHEYGLYSEWEKIPKAKCRPFNEIEIRGEYLIKRPITEQGKELASREVAWYKKLAGMNVINLPEVYKYNPLTMELIDGKNIYEYTDISEETKRDILRQIIGCLKKVHSLESIPADKASYENAYIGKTLDRLNKVRDLVPFANNKTVLINGKTCRNVFFCWDLVTQRIMEYMPERFFLIHGDCTFSNMMMRSNGTPVLIDPRGYFGYTEYYGDVAYDWVKIYYSLFSNYDQFNLKRFKLDIQEDGIELDIASNHWEKLEEYFFELVADDVCKSQMKLLLAIIWLSLTTYAWDDYDSICGAFYNGLYYLEEALDAESF